MHCGWHMTTYITSDLHLKHVNILTYTTSRSHFKDVDEMTETVINNFNERVGQNDKVIILGDVAMGQRTLHKNLVSRLNGHKILVYGNHDVWRVRDGKDKRDETFDELSKRWLDYGMEEVHESLTIDDPTHGSIYMRHIPTRSFTANYHLCGHVHEAFDRLNNIINVGVDVRQLQPKTVDELIFAPHVGLMGNHRMEDLEMEG
jgi:calcineurin-like phosphoesterase family protein